MINPNISEKTNLRFREAAAVAVIIAGFGINLLDFAAAVVALCFGFQGVSVSAIILTKKMNKEGAIAADIGLLLCFSYVVPDLDSFDWKDARLPLESYDGNSLLNDGLYPSREFSYCAPHPYSRLMRVH
jgi:hypothetical protein